MSSDTYIDFHSPESWERRPNWNLWSAFLTEQEIKNRREHYCPVRISYSHNVTMDCNYDLWEEFVEDFDGHYLNLYSYSVVSICWRELYDRAQNPPGRVYACNDNRFCRDDMMAPENFDSWLRKYFGYYIRFRID